MPSSLVYKPLILCNWWPTSIYPRPGYTQVVVNVTETFTGLCGKFHAWVSNSVVTVSHQLNRLQWERSFDPAYSGHGSCHFTISCYVISAHLDCCGILSVHLQLLPFQFWWLSTSHQETGKVFHPQIFLTRAIFEKRNQLVCFRIKSCSGHRLGSASGSSTKPIRVASCSCHFFPQLVTFDSSVR